MLLVISNIFCCVLFVRSFWFVAILCRKINLCLELVSGWEWRTGNEKYSIDSIINSKKSGELHNNSETVRPTLYSNVILWFNRRFFVVVAAALYCLLSAWFYLEIRFFSSFHFRCLRYYEPHLSSIALSNVESSRTIAQVLYEMNETRPYWRRMEIHQKNHTHTHTLFSTSRKTTLDSFFVCLFYSKRRIFFLFFLYFLLVIFSDQFILRITFFFRSVSLQLRMKRKKIN